MLDGLPVKRTRRLHWRRSSTRPGTKLGNLEPCHCTSYSTGRGELRCGSRRCPPGGPSRLTRGGPKTAVSLTARLAIMPGGWAFPHAAIVAGGRARHGDRVDHRPPLLPAHHLAVDASRGCTGSVPTPRESWSLIQAHVRGVRWTVRCTRCTICVQWERGLACRNWPRPGR